MAIRLERSGGLIFIKGGPDPPEREKRSGKIIESVGLGLLAVALLLIASGLASAQSLDWATLSHTVKAFLAAI